MIFLFLTYGFGFFAKLLFLFLLGVVDLLFVFRTSSQRDALTRVPWTCPSRSRRWPCSASAFGSLSPRCSIRSPARCSSHRRRSSRRLKKELVRLVRAARDLRHPLRPLAKSAFREMHSSRRSRAQRKAKVGGKDLTPEPLFPSEFGYVKLTAPDGDPHGVLGARLTAQGIDIHEQWVFAQVRAGGPLAH
ncbi:MAG: hypothetical protein IPG50_30690 [Myxococcales bacterium]|nr:hypothetical protein [Myxococcales bacterium]